MWPRSLWCQQKNNLLNSSHFLNQQAIYFPLDNLMLIYHTMSPVSPVFSFYLPGWREKMLIEESCLQKMTLQMGHFTFITSLYFHYHLMHGKLPTWTGKYFVNWNFSFSVDSNSLQDQQHCWPSVLSMLKDGEFWYESLAEDLWLNYDLFSISTVLGVKDLTPIKVLLLLHFLMELNGEIWISKWQGQIPNSVPVLQIPYTLV